MIIVALVMAACTPQPAARPSTPAPPPVPSASSTAAEARTLRYALEGLATIVPGDAVTTDELIVADATFDALTRVDDDGSVRPAAATRWESDDQQLWTFHLREGATWHDGSPVTAEDFVYAWTRTAAEGRASYLLDQVAGAGEARQDKLLRGVRAVDPLTFEVTLARENADFPTVAGHPSLAPLPRAVREADVAAFTAQPVGNGPFAVAGDLVVNQFVRVRAFPGWRNGRRSGDVEAVLFQVSDRDTAYVQFQQGRKDVAPLPAGALASAQESLAGPDDQAELDTGLSGQLYFLGLRVDQPPFDRPELRQAFSLAIDRNALAEVVREGNAAPARAAVSPVVPGARPRPCDACVYDRAAARQLFAAAEVDSFDLWYNRGGGHEPAMQEIARQLAQIGVRVVLRTPEPVPGETPLRSYLRVLAEGRPGAFRFGWSIDHLTLADALRPVLRSDGSANLGGYASEDVDVLLDEAGRTADDDERARLYREAEDLAIDRDQALVPLLVFRHALVVDTDIDGLELGPLLRPDLAQVRVGAASAS